MVADAGGAVMDVLLALRQIAFEAAAARLGIRPQRPLDHCKRCGCPLFEDDEGSDALPCEDGCVADLQIAEALL